MLQVCLNGARERSACEALPVAARELGDAAAEAVAAGAADIHLHPRDDDGRDTMEPAFVDAAVAAVRSAAPGVPVGVTTGAWTEPDPLRRAALVRSWSVLPDHASVNWHEEGAEAVAEALLDTGVRIEAGVFSGTDAAARLRAWPHAHRVLRVLAEVTDPDPGTARDTACRLLDELAGDRRPAGPAGPAGRPRPRLLLHGEDGGAWPVLRLAAERGLDARIGLEDVLLLPDGAPAADNAALVRAALRLMGCDASGSRPAAGRRSRW
ncbi:3-keto-5-aminohexanoate cleavage protein [Streptomyces sp. V4-01]|uniref:3-keto-5-aminohexanoate cleavage protein n=1 Tax=Actinacidiphila polyblastidii TaxID=3110430 RepID=A0ABU7PL67_9ACTN|nr:3-keto-5-aminohexanoate cleavage protein [Streptomyces sp. V4-01]